MGQERKHSPVLLICGLLASNSSLLDDSLALLKTEFGETFLESETIAFDFTDYYNKEMGDGILRKYIAFCSLIRPETIGLIKRKTNRLEQKFSAKNNRRINIDPGYITLAKLVLATTKDATHRIYLGNCIYAETTLYYCDNCFRPWIWTYPDYRSQFAVKFFNNVRELYKLKLKERDCP
ncbi:DUF4416 family protein [bacterium]|nr:DUF4416 family protein [bacterium]